LTLASPSLIASRIAYAFSTDPENVYSVSSWPGGDRIAPKTPTTLLYDSDGSFKCGYELNGLEGQTIERIKLLFDPEQPRPFFIPVDVEAELAKLPKSVSDVASDYMRAIYQHALKEIEGNYLDLDFLNQYQKQYVLTVPAVWSDKAKDMTLRVRALLLFLSCWITLTMNKGSSKCWYVTRGNDH
jgi:hypothetical protein